MELLHRPMLDLAEINRVVERVAAVTLKPAKLSRVYSESRTDSEGHEALRVTIVFQGDKIDDVSGDSALDTIVRVHRDLRSSGEERYPIIEFATEAELDLNADPES